MLAKTGESHLVNVQHTEVVGFHLRANTVDGNTLAGPSDTKSRTVNNDAQIRDGANNSLN